MNTSIPYQNWPNGILTIKAPEPGKIVAVIAGIHGNEQGGVTALVNAVSSFVIEKGTVHYVIGNPLALKHNVRFTEMNLNRAFIRNPLSNPTQESSYERKRAHELMTLFDTCDATLDLHSVNNRLATPFIICEKEHFPLASNFPFPFVSSGWNTIEPGSTDYYMSTVGKPGICLECGYHNDPQTIDRSLDGIKTFLGVMGNISYTPKPAGKQKVIDAKEVYITKESFSLTREFQDFEQVSKGTIIGHDGNDAFRMPQDGFIIFARNISTSGQEAVILSY